ncbi:MAG TPA: hypothetical protein VFJ58_20895 [Armatimonadota bacterium]|nr:hypothetical protein [Armatimonadota bacterium]
MRYVREQGGISNAEYRALTNISACSASGDLKDLADKGLLHRQSLTGRGTRYVLVNPQNRQETRKKPAMGAGNGVEP